MCTIFRHTGVEMQGLAESESEVRPLLLNISLLAPKVKWFCIMSGSQTLFSNNIKLCLLKWANWVSFHDLCDCIMKHKWPMLCGESTTSRGKNLLLETTMSIHFTKFGIFKSNSFLSIFCELLKVGNWMDCCILKSRKPVVTLSYRASWLVSVGRPSVVNLHCFSLCWVISI